jgi:hypothetical protein
MIHSRLWRPLLSSHAGSEALPLRCSRLDDASAPHQKERRQVRSWRGPFHAIAQAIDARRSWTKRKRTDRSRAQLSTLACAPEGEHPGFGPRAAGGVPERHRGGVGRSRLLSSTNGIRGMYRAATCGAAGRAVLSLEAPAFPIAERMQRAGWLDDEIPVALRDGGHRAGASRRRGASSGCGRSRCRYAGAWGCLGSRRCPSTTAAARSSSLRLLIRDWSRSML